MLTLSTAISFFGASILLAVAPGPDILFVLTQSLTNGRKAGLWVALGNVGGLIFHTAAVALGLGALISTSPMAYNTLKYLGAAYLVYLGIKAIRKHAGGELASVHKTDEVSNWDLFIRGAIVSITNPHVTVLFVAFLPQFIEVDRGMVPLQVVSLGLIFMVAALMVFAAVALASGLVRQKIVESPSMLANIDRVAGVVFIGLAIKLFLG